MSLAPDSNVPECEGDGEETGKEETLPELEVVTAGEDVTLWRGGGSRRTR